MFGCFLWQPFVVSTNQPLILDFGSSPKSHFRNPSAYALLRAPTCVCSNPKARSFDLGRGLAGRSWLGASLTSTAAPWARGSGASAQSMGLRSLGRWLMAAHGHRRRDRHLGCAWGGVDVRAGGWSERQKTVSQLIGTARLHECKLKQTQQEMD